ncbi:MAG TPA: cytochrome C oxidase subunit I, partial [Chitinophagaceae bacterium]
MTKATAHNSSLKNTTHKVVVPFYMYAALALLAGTIMLFFATNAFHGHYFHPQILAITHTMALGWGTMMILGASHQLVPVLIESELYSTSLAYVSFFLAAAGIPMLVYGFYHFRFNWITISGGVLINLALVSFLVNIAVSISKAKKENVHAIFIFTATSWLLITTLLGLLLVINFTHPIFNQDSLEYLSLHAHMGIAGWFLLLVMGVGTRLIPM